QVHGAIVQGIGQALFEGVIYEDGQPRTGSFMDYGVARAADVPSFAVVHVEDPTLGNPLRVKGGGEGGIIAATAVVVSALCDALRDYGVKDLTMPVSPLQLWEAMNPAPQPA
ncbi:MAG: xanthine dehydrogenase, partial [Caulobacteraceae bacterium]|nr:xanthine dehydrogenase [Caulobacteraceae bacterium]